MLVIGLYLNHSDGKMIILGGYDCSLPTDKPKKMYDMDKATIFDIHTQQWHEQIIAGPIIPPPRAYHTSVTSKKKKKKKKKKELYHL
jgi:hypothetical protein